MTEESIQPFLDWIRAHPHWSGLIVCLISLSESLAVVGLVVPGVVLMTAIGSMMGAGILPFWATLGWAILGAIIGDGVSYWLGYHYHQHLRDFWPFKQFPKLLARGEQFFRQHGGKSIIIGRFVGPVRPMIPVIAGMMDMTPRKFLFFNIASAIVWAPLYSLPGILIGATLGNLSSEDASRIGLLILIFLLILWALYAFLIRIGLFIGKTIWNAITTLWKKLEATPRFKFLHPFLASKQGHAEGQLALILLGVFSIACFIIITYDVSSETGLLLWNDPIYQLFRALYQEKITRIMAFISALSNPHYILPLSMIIAVWLLWKGRLMVAATWLLTIGCAELIARVIREWVAMPRPEGLVLSLQTYSYPSGHTLTAVLFFGMLGAFLHPNLSRHNKYLLWIIIIPLILMIGFSRIYLGMHWFTDVLASLMLGIGAIAFGLFFYRRLDPKTPPLELYIPAVIVLCLSMTFYAIKIYPEEKIQLQRQWPKQELVIEHWWNDANEQYLLFRSGALKKQATIFDIQWLGSLDAIQTFFTNNHWEQLNELNFKTGLLLLAKNPVPDLLPVTPKFHRDRLPVLIYSKPINARARMVFQLWQSDYVGPNNIPLYVGTLRYETATSPIPFVTFYMESSEHSEISLQREFVDDLKKAKDFKYRIETLVLPNKEPVTILRIKTLT